MTKMHRRAFLAAAGMTALAHGQAISVPSKSTPLACLGSAARFHASSSAGESLRFLI